MRRMQTRTQDITRFLEQAGWTGAQRTPLAGDASFRRYERIHKDGVVAVLMDAPPPQEDVRPFIRAAQQLQTLGLSAPQVLAEDVGRGFLLLEDLGDSLYSRELRHSPALEEQLYLEAAKVLAALYHDRAKVDVSGFPAYDTALLMRECMLLAEWFLPAVMPQEKAAKLAEEYRQIWLGLLHQLPALPPVLVLRDYHADNLLWLPKRQGNKRVGLLDFQDAVIGSPAYDMVSYLEDARRDVSPEVVQASVKAYLNETGLNRDKFMISYALLGAQRNCKIIGIFVRLCVRDGKQNYLGYLPRVWAHLLHDVSHPALSVLAVWLERHILPEWRGVITPLQQATKTGT